MPCLSAKALAAGRERDPTASTSQLLTCTRSAVKRSAMWPVARIPHRIGRSGAMAPIVGGVDERVEAPRWLADHAQAFQASGAAPAVPRLAATVVLLRPLDAGGFEVYVQRRAATMAFAPGMYA